MCSKFGATFFAQKLKGIGPQASSFNNADENGHSFYVAHQYKIDPNGKPLWEYGSYENLDRFLNYMKDVPASERFFFEQIRDGRPCWEYYDLEWNPSETEDTEQSIFEEFLEQRNKFCPLYPVSVSECRVLSASSTKKGSMHIILPKSRFKFRDNSYHLKDFVHAFREHIGGYAIANYIDWTVYTKNRSFRCIDSSKRNDQARILRAADWHDASLTACKSEFLSLMSMRMHKMLRMVTLR